jgi:hypothetical protein
MQPKAMHKSAPPLTAAQLADARAIRSYGRSSLIWLRAA